MKRYLSLVLFISVSVISIGQPGKKTGQQKVPSQAEINKMMQDELEKLPPEQKALAEQMMKQQLQKNNGTGGNGMIPALKKELLAKIPKLTTAEQYMP